MGEREGQGTASESLACLPQLRPYRQRTLLALRILRAQNKSRHVVVKLFQRGLVRVDHVPGFIELELDILLQRGGNRQMLHLEDAFVERRRQIEIACV